jgi:molybdopterin-guanine dinucleotide biosynthesis protein
MVGGHTRNIGKTSVVEGLIRALPEMGWTAVKITQFGHGVCSVNGEACDCAVTEHQFSISEERAKDSGSDKNFGSDTARFVAAGARRSLWVRTKQGDLLSALPALRQEIASDEFVIVESNSLRRFLKPKIYIQLLDWLNPDFKQSAQDFFDLADAYVIVARSESELSRNEIKTEETKAEETKSALLAREIRKRKPCFNVRAEDRFMSQPLIEFVRGKLKQ